jgi:hypothetical protein
MSIATATAIHFLFAPTPPGTFKMDAMFEIGVMSTTLNVALPLGIVGLVCGSILCLRRALSPLPLILLASTFLAVIVCTLELWRYMAGQHGPNINLWANHIWWYVGR